jgi:hypothetical protein
MLGTAGGVNEVPASAIRGINKCRETMYGGFWKIIISVYQYKDLPLGQSDMFTRGKILIVTFPTRGRGWCLRNVF